MSNGFLLAIMVMWLSTSLVAIVLKSMGVLRTKPQTIAEIVLLSLFIATAFSFIANCLVYGSCKKSAYFVSSLAICLIASLFLYNA
jgi:hypothetical protein